MNRAWFTLSLAAVIAATLSSPALAWGRLGHRVISRFAESRLTPAAKAGIAALLETGESIADASMWADDYRSRHRNTAPWHYVNVPLDEPRYDDRFADKRRGSIIDKMAEFKATLKDSRRSLEDRRFALRFLVHLVGDLHQPMHVGDNRDRGGNNTQVRWFDQGTNMHRLGTKTSFARTLGARLYGSRSWRN